LRVCLVSYEFPPEIGGEASYTYCLATGLSSLGHRVTVLLPKKNGVEYLEDGRFAALRVGTSSLPMLKVASFVVAVNRALPALVAERGIEVVHIAFDYASLPVRVKGIGAPVLATVHHLHMAEAIGMRRAGRNFVTGLGAAYRDFALSFMELVLLRRVARAIAVSRFTQDSLRDYLRVPPERMRVVHHGVQFDDLLDAKDSGRARQEFGLGTGPLLLYVGRLDRSKGLECLLEAFATVNQSAPGIRLVVVGQGKESYAGSLRTKADSLGIGASVAFTGKVGRGELCELYAASTALVLPSLMEGFGISLIEAMTAGKPCIATRVGAVPEVVQHRRTGLLVPPGDPGELSAAILAVFSSPDRGAGMGEKGREVALRDFTVERMAMETAAVYAESSGEGRLAPSVKYDSDR
jgi:glycosyltransferase involved in cell wall biosynthesis